MKEPDPSNQVPSRATRQKTGSFCSDLLSYQGIFQMAFLMGLGGSLSFGFQLVAISFTSPFIKAFINDTWLERHKVPGDDQTVTFLWPLIVTIFNIGGLIGALFSRYLLAKYSRKKSLIINSLLALVATVVVGTSKTAKSFEMILLGRFLYGFTATLHVCVQSQYLSEISPTHLRGMFNVIGGIFINLGKFLGPVAGLHELLGTESLWPLLLMSSGTLGLIVLVALPFFPESPSYLLIQKGDSEGSLKALKEFWGDAYQQAEASNMLEEQSSVRRGRVMTILELLRDRSLRYQMCLLFAIGSGPVMCGIDAIYFYLPDVLRAAGLNEQVIPYAALGLGGCELCSSFVCFFIIERIGRRKLLVWEYGLMALILALLTATISVQDQASWIPYSSIALICLDFFLYGVGPRPTMVPVIAELFTQPARPAALTMTLSLSWTGATLVGLLFPYLVRYANNFCFLFFVGYIAIIWVFIYRFLPETMGKSFTDIQREFKSLRMRKKGNPV